MDGTKKRGQLSGKMTSTKITGKQFDEARERVNLEKTSLRAKPKVDRASPFRRMVCSVFPGEGIKVCFDNKADYEKSIRTMYNINKQFKGLAKKRGIDNWHEFDMAQDHNKFVLYIKRNKFNDKEEETENGMAV